MPVRRSVLLTSSCYRYDDVETKIKQTEKENETARKESKKARDEFNDIKKKRYKHMPHLIKHMLMTFSPAATCSIRPSLIYPKG